MFGSTYNMVSSSLSPQRSPQKSPQKIRRERIYWEEDFKLPSIVKSGKGVEGDFPVSEFHYKIDTFS